ncbi:MAG: DUF2306 domain-containing protein [Acidobacteria bacterium]|nr:DUF2306 domain-containing protein [Acidobacteriota bacterium]
MFSGSLLPKARKFCNRRVLVNFLLLATLAFFVFLMARITLPYIPYNTDVGFLRIKQDYIDLDFWRTAFFVHVYMSIWVLLAGFTQFSNKIRTSYPKWHRALGYFYAVDVVLITGPAGFIMGFYANGGVPSKISFVILAIGWITFTVLAVLKAKEGDYNGHRDFMIRSYALTLSALTLRAWKWGINNSFDLHPMDVYRAVAWLGWVPNILLAEFIIWRYKYEARRQRLRMRGSNTLLSAETDPARSEIAISA